MLKFKLFTGLFLIFLGVSAAWAQRDNKTNPALTEEFLQMEQSIEDAVVRADLEHLKKVYAEDFRFAHGSGSVQNKAEWLISVGKKQFISRKISASEVELHKDIAVTSARLDVVRRGKDGDEKYWLKYIRVYRKKGKSWRMISHRTILEIHL